MRGQNRKTNFLFFGFLAGDKQLAKHFAREKSPQVSALRFQSGIIEGLVMNGARIKVISTLPIASFPRNPSILIGSSRFTTGLFDTPGLLMGFINLPIVKLLCRFLTSLCHGGRELISDDSIDGLILYSAHTPYLLVGIVLKKIFRVPIAVFIPDLPMYMQGNLHGLRAVAKSVDDKLLRWLMKQVDVAFPITAGIATDWLPSSCRHMVVEGIAPSSDAGTGTVPTFAAGGVAAQSTKRILYAGTFLHVLGFARLFSAHRDLRATLTCVGGGPDAVGLSALAEVDDRIVVKPFLFGDDLTREMESADFLLNPRDSRWIGGRYSFPSKLFNYMGRGRPIMSTRMPGIPDEYFECFLEVLDDSPDNFRHSMDSALTTSNQELEARVRIGIEIVTIRKSPLVVGAAILDALQ